MDTIEPVLGTEREKDQTTVRASKRKAMISAIAVTGIVILGCVIYSTLSRRQKRSIGKSFTKELTKAFRQIAQQAPADVDPITAPASINRP